MKTYPSAVVAHRAASKEFYTIHFLSFRVRDNEGTHIWKCFSTRVENETVEVLNTLTGETTYRDYVGGGTIVSTDPIVRSEGLTITNMQVLLSGTSPEVLDMVYGHDCRDAMVQWHVGEGEEGTGLLLAAPEIEFDGFVVDIERSDAAIGADGAEPSDSVIAVTLAGHMHALDRSNPEIRSYESGKERQGAEPGDEDEIFRYAHEANQWDTPWGREGRRDKKRGRNTDDGKDRPDLPRRPTSREPGSWR